jgi:hypothetical protein
MMLVVAVLTAAGLYLAQRNATGALEQDLQRDFQADLAALHNVEQIRYAALAERCRLLVAKPRIHAALEDNALDLLYPSAKDELRDIMQDEAKPQPDQVSGLPHARFYRFLGRTGAVLPPPINVQMGLPPNSSIWSRNSRTAHTIPPLQAQSADRRNPYPPIGRTDTRNPATANEFYAQYGT